MEIDLSWKYSEVVCNLKALKSQYKEILASFYYTKDEYKFIKEIKDKIYSFNFDINKKDRIWEYLNDDLSQFEIILFFKFIE